MSLRFERAMSEWREMRAEYELKLYADYDAAEEACLGEMLNDRGRRAGIDPVSLFYGNETRAFAYASDELREWWETHPRTTVAAFEASWPYPDDELDT